MAPAERINNGQDEGDKLPEGLLPSRAERRRINVQFSEMPSTNERAVSVKRAKNGQ